jgi:protein-L-isoaspartate(D-aspartate) O-methyltransferase
MDLEPDWEQLRARMVAVQLRARDIVDENVLRGMGIVPRHRFVPDAVRLDAYDDRPLSLGHGSTISQPYVVAYTLQVARVRPGHRVLDIGSGCGYQAAVAAAMGATVIGVEIVEELALRSRAILAELGYGTVTIEVGDGRHGWPQAAPYDAIVVGAAPREVPAALVEQLAEGGTLVLPVGERWGQHIRIVTRTASGVREEVGIPVRFVPLVGDDAL